MNLIMGIIALLFVAGFTALMVKLFFTVNGTVLVLVILLLLLWSSMQR